MAKVAHITSVHPRTDARIFIKECVSLAEAGHEVELLVADGLGEDLVDGVRIRSVRRPRSRVHRLVFSGLELARLAKRSRFSVCHLHDPELLGVALYLKLCGAKVIFDSHEDVPKQILGKSYLPRLLRGAIARGYAMFERLVCRWLDAVVAATPAILRKFESICPVSCNVSNFPKFSDIAIACRVDELTRRDRAVVCYVGGISRSRGIVELVHAASLFPDSCRLVVAGAFMEAGLHDEVSKLDGWANVDYRGWVDRSGVMDVLSAACIGVVALHPTPAYEESLPVKMFEYMAAGLAVVASDFPLWREIIEHHDCGVCVDPHNSEALAEAVRLLVNHPEEARRMGENGRRAVREHYNWDIEERKLRRLYEDLLRDVAA